MLSTLQNKNGKLVSNVLSFMTDDNPQNVVIICMIHTDFTLSKISTLTALGTKIFHASAYVHYIQTHNTILQVSV